jgi:hypothetical protein
MKGLIAGLSSKKWFVTIVALILVSLQDVLGLSQQVLESIAQIAGTYVGGQGLVDAVSAHSAKKADAKHTNINP